VIIFGASRRPSAWSGRCAFEEKWDRHIKDLGDVLKAAGADAVGSLLVFLDLLECQPEGVREFRLAHIEHEPPHPHAAADMHVDDQPRDGIGLPIRRVEPLASGGEQCMSNLVHFGTMLGSPPGVPGGGITGVMPPPTGGAEMPGSIPAGGQITPFERDNSSLRLALPVVSPAGGRTKPPLLA
jgi:hypothetical protein